MEQVVAWVLEPELFETMFKLSNKLDDMPEFTGAAYDPITGAICIYLRISQEEIVKLTDIECNEIVESGILN